MSESTPTGSQAKKHTAGALLCDRAFLPNPETAHLALRGGSPWLSGWCRSERAASLMPGRRCGASNTQIGRFCSTRGHAERILQKGCGCNLEITSDRATRGSAPLWSTFYLALMPPVLPLCPCRPVAWIAAMQNLMRASLVAEQMLHLHFQKPAA